MNLHSDPYLVSNPYSILTARTTCSPSLFRGLRDSDRESLCVVCDFSHSHLSDIERRSGESYAEHGCRVATVLSENSTDVSLLKVAVLHDILVHKDGPALLSASPLSKSERELLVQMHGLRRLHIDESTKDLDTVISAFMEDTRLLPLRMAHRLNDVRHLSLFLPTLRKKIAKETLHMYTAIAGRLGMHAWRYEMEDECFPIVQPKACANLRSRFENVAELDQACLEHTKEFLAKNLRNEGIDSHMDFRVKGLYSTYRKMVIKKRRFEDLTDRLAVRIVVPEIMDCYRTLAVVHACMHPIPGKLKDYIGAPKENGYQSIHTVVYPLPGVTEQPMEIQIRSEDMHQICEHGHASHAEYKTLMYALNARSARVNLFRNLQNLHEEARSPQQFQKAMRKYFREDHIAIFDGQDNLYHFKQPVSAMDFVCTVHSNRCDKLKEIRINGRKMPISSRLHDGDIVEVKFTKEKTIQADWAHACCHSVNRKKLSSVSLS